MTPKEFKSKFLPFALESEKRTKVPALFTLAQAALETGWGQYVKANNFFGIKDTDGVNGNEIEFLTTEWSKTRGVFYKIKQYFRAYKTPAECFIDHGNFLVKNKRYAKAFYFTYDAVKFAEQVAKAGYATDPKYFQKIETIISLIKKV